MASIMKMRFLACEKMRLAGKGLLAAAKTTAASKGMAASKGIDMAAALRTTAASREIDMAAALRTTAARREIDMAAATKTTAASREIDMAAALRTTAAGKSIESNNNRKMFGSPSSPTALQDVATNERLEPVLEALVTTVLKDLFSKEMWPVTRDNIIAPLVDGVFDQVEQAAKKAIKTAVAVVTLSFLVADTTRAVVSKKGFTYNLGKKVAVLQG